MFLDTVLSIIRKGYFGCKCALMVAIRFGYRKAIIDSGGTF
jgi:hypothetical protein